MEGSEEAGYQNVGYGRVSTDKQDEEAQRDALIKAGCYPVITETVSSQKKKRAGLEEALAIVAPGGTLTVWGIDRMARSMLETLTIVERIKDEGKYFKSLTQSFDTSKPEGKMMLGILASFAEYERSILVRRTLTGLDAARAKGRFGGRRRVLYGRKLAEAKRLLADGTLSQSEVAARLKVSVSTLVRYAVNNGIPRGQKLLARFLAKNPDAAAWLERTEDPDLGKRIKPRTVAA